MAQVYLSQYAKRTALADSATSSSYAATASYINPIRLDPIQDPNPTGLLYPTSTYLYQSSSNTPLGYDLYIRQDGNLTKWKWIEGMLNTGLLYGGVLSYSASSFLITPGAGLIINHNAVTGSEIGPMIEYVTWGPITQSIENIATYQNTFVYIDVSGSASQQNVFFSPEQYQNYIPIGRVSHYNNVVANNAYGNVQTVYDIDGQQNIFVRAFGPLKLKGIATSGQAGTLRLNISSGTAFNLGGYYPYNPETPSTYNMSTYNTASIIRIYRSGSGYKFDDNGGSYYTTIDPTKYDDGTGILATVNNNDWSIQRVMVNPVTGRAHVYYGQGFYDTFDDAIGAIFSDEFVESDATAFTYPFSAYLIVKGLTTDLTNTSENEIIQAGLFRNTAGGGGTGGGGIPGGSDTQIQFNNAGVFDGEPEFTFNPSTNIVRLTGSMFVSGAISSSFGSNTIGFYGTASWAVSASQAVSSSYALSASYALSSSRAVTASYALTASVAVSSSYASASPNFANTNLVFTGNRNHSTNGYHYFIYNQLLGGGGTSPFDGFAVSGGFYFFDNDSNALGVAKSSTSTYRYIEITTQSINLGFTADPAVTNTYIFTNPIAYFSSSLNVTKSIFFPGLTTQPQVNVVIVDTASGQLYYTASSAIGGGATANVAISSSGTGLTPTVASIDFTGGGVIATTVGDNVTVTIPGGAGVAGGANTQIQFNSGSEFSGSGNFSFDYNNNIVYLTGSSLTSGSIRLTGSMFVSGAISASFGSNTVGFFGTASWAQSASFVTASNVWGPFGSSSVSSASYASGSTSASYAATASFASSASAAPFDTYIQYNSGGLFAATGSFRFIYASQSLQQGFDTTASGLFSHAQGYFTIASGASSHAEGGNTLALGGYSHAEGSNTVALGGYSHAEGFQTLALGGYSHAEGNLTTASGNYSHAEGFGTVASGSYQLVIGQYNAINTSQSAFIIGDGIDASNRRNILFVSRSHFEVSASSVFLQGLPTSSELNVLVYNSASGRVYYASSSAVGSGPAPSDTFIQFNSGSKFGADQYFRYIYTSESFQHGFNTTASGLFSHAQGHSGTALGGYSHAEGYQVLALGGYSHAEGRLTTSSGEFSHAEGFNTIALGQYQLTIGQYNVTNTSQSAFIIGDGTSNSNRHNLLFASQSWFEVSASNIFLQGLNNTAKTNVVTIDTTTGQLFYTASNTIGGGGSGTPTPPGGLNTQIQFNSGSEFSGSGNFTFDYVNNITYLTGSSLITGSLTVTGSTSVLGTSSIDGIAFIGTSSAYALYTTAKITTVAGINTIYSLQTASYDGAFFDYTLISGTNARAGQIMSIWSGSQIKHTETTTTDIGSTSEFIFSVALTAGSASLQVTGSTGAIIKTIIKGI